MKPFLSKVIGTGNSKEPCFSTHYPSGATAFACGGVISVIVPKTKSRFEFVVQDDIKEITALSFSQKTAEIVLGERGTNARIFVISLSNTFNKILSKIEIKTKENGFSHVALSNDSTKLISISNDEKPFLLLWDLTQPKPAVSGYYHLSQIPKHLHVSQDGKLAIVSGQKLLRFINLQPKQSDKPEILTTHNGNVGRLKQPTFVAAALSPVEPYDAFCLTSEGTIYVFERAGVLYSVNSKLRVPLSIAPVHLNCGKTTCLAVDNKIITVGTENGSVLAIRKETDKGKAQYVIFGKFPQENKCVEAISLSKKMVSVSYSDGTIIVWYRKMHVDPALILAAHCGPVTTIVPINDEMSVATAGSDGTVRLWDIGGDAKSKQGERITKQVSKRPDDFSAAITGIRCIASIDDFILAGDCFGSLHVLMKDTLNEIQNISVTKQPITAVACSNKKAVIGTEVGKLFFYDVTPTGLILKCNSQVQSSTISALCVTDEEIISSGSDGVIITDFNLRTKSSVPGATISISLIPNKKFVVAGLLDGNVNIIRISDGTIFRSYKLSSSAYPIKVKVEPKSGLIIGVCMSDGTVRIVDTFSGDQVFVFYSMAGLVTDANFILGDLAVSSFNGFCSVWTMPPSIHTAIQQKLSPVPNFIEEDKEEDAKAADKMQQQTVRGSIMRSSIANGFFEEVKNNGASLETVIEETAEEEEEQESTTAFDAPRPSQQGEYESNIDNLVRASFIKRDRCSRIENVADALKDVFEKAQAILANPPDDCEKEVSELGSAVESAQRGVFKDDWFKQLLHDKVDAFLATKV